MESGTDVWIKNLDYSGADPNESLWIASKIISSVIQKDGKRYIKVLTKGEKESSYCLQLNELESDELKLRNPNPLNEMDDLIKLSFLNEPEILYRLKSRYFSGINYTFTGPILISIRPIEILKEKLEFSDTLLKSLCGNILRSTRFEIIMSKKREITYLQPILTSWFQKSTSSSITISNAKLRFMKAIRRKIFQQAVERTKVVLEVLEKQLNHSSNDTDNSKNNNDSFKSVVKNVDEVKDRFSLWSDNGHHSILLSGESGSGKTDLSNSILLSIANISLSSDNALLNEAIKMKSNQEIILLQQASNVLQSFGNASTIGNENSSRFGKYIELFFDTSNAICSGVIHTYMLESYRVSINRPAHDKIFHIFYQVAIHSSSTYKLQRKLNDFNEFLYLYPSVAIGEVKSDGMSLNLNSPLKSASKIDEITNSLISLDFNMDSIIEIFDIVCSILHLGQLQFHPTSKGITSETTFHDACNIQYITQKPNTWSENPNAFLGEISQLCGVPLESLHSVLTSKWVTSGSERIRVPLSPQNCALCRDAFCRAMYKLLFDNIVQRINRKLTAGIESSEINVLSSIGILDIFGFDSLPCNSLEQLCINYANEVLQQQFNENIFYLGISDYEAEGVRIDQSKVKNTMPDNVSCINMIHVRIFKRLEDQSKLPTPSDVGFANQLYKDLEKWSNTSILASPYEQSRGQFLVNHYAGPVLYDSTGFVEKNMDQLSSEAYDLIRKSTNSMLSSNLVGMVKAKGISIRFSDNTLALATNSTKSSAPSELSKFKPVSKTWWSHGKVAQFKSDVELLISQVNATVPHYIRCIKPVSISHESPSNLSAKISNESPANFSNFNLSPRIHSEEDSDEQKSPISPRSNFFNTALQRTNLSELKSQALPKEAAEIISYPGLRRSSSNDNKNNNKTEPLVKTSVKANYTNRPISSQMSSIRRGLKRSSKGKHIYTSAFQTTFDEMNVVKQLQFGGILQAIRIIRSGFPVHMNHAEFYLRYRRTLAPSMDNKPTSLPFLLSTTDEKDEKALHFRDYCEQLIKAFSSDHTVTKTNLPSSKSLFVRSELIYADSIKSGMEHVFIENNAHAELERSRARLFIFVDQLKTLFRGYKARIWFRKVIRDIIIIQSTVRAKQARQKVRRLRSGRRINQWIHSRIDRRRYLAFRRAVTIIQTRWKWKKAMYYAVIKMMKLRSVATTLQSKFRQSSSKRRLHYLKQVRMHKIDYLSIRIVPKQIQKGLGKLLVRPAGLNNRSNYDMIVETKMDDNSKPAKFQTNINEDDNGTHFLTKSVLSKLRARELITEEQYLHSLNIQECKRFLNETTSKFQQMRMKTQLVHNLALTINDAVTLLDIHKLQPSMKSAFLCLSFGSRKSKSNKRQEKVLTQDHVVFHQIHSVVKIVKRLIQYSVNQQLILERQKNKNPTPKIEEDIKFLINFIEFLKTLLDYYDSFITHFIAKYGDQSAFREKFGLDLQAYYIALSKFIVNMQKQNHLSNGNTSPNRKEMTKSNLVDDWLHKKKEDPKESSIPNIHSLANILERNDSSENGQNNSPVVFKPLSIAPGIEYALNSLFFSLKPEIQMIAPVHIVKLVTKSPINYGSEFKLLASRDISPLSHEHVINQPRFLKCMDYPSFCLVILSSLLLNIRELHPSELMIRYVNHKRGDHHDSKDHKKESKYIESLGFHSSETLIENSFCSYDSTEDVKNATVNYLYFFPHMDVVIDEEILEIFRNEESFLYLELTIIRWLHSLHIQNRRYERLLSCGFAPKELSGWMLPIYLPKSWTTTLHNRMCTIRWLVKQGEVTPHAIFSEFQPEQALIYKERREKLDPLDISASVVEQFEQFNSRGKMKLIEKQSPQEDKGINKTISIEIESAKNSQYSHSTSFRLSSYDSTISTSAKEKLTNKLLPSPILSHHKSALSTLFTPPSMKPTSSGNGSMKIKSEDDNELTYDVYVVETEENLQGNILDAFSDHSKPSSKKFKNPYLSHSKGDEETNKSARNSIKKSVISNSHKQKIEGDNRASASSYSVIQENEMSSEAVKLNESDGTLPSMGSIFWKSNDAMDEDKPLVNNSIGNQTGELKMNSEQLIVSSPDEGVGSGENPHEIKNSEDVSVSTSALTGKTVHTPQYKFEISIEVSTKEYLGSIDFHQNSLCNSELSFNLRTIGFNVAFLTEMQLVNMSIIQLEHFTKSWFESLQDEIGVEFYYYPTTAMRGRDMNLTWQLLTKTINFIHRSSNSSQIVAEGMVEESKLYYQSISESRLIERLQKDFGIRVQVNGLEVEYKDSVKASSPFPLNRFKQKTKKKQETVMPAPLTPTDDDKEKQRRKRKVDILLETYVSAYSPTKKLQEIANDTMVVKEFTELSFQMKLANSTSSTIEVNPQLLESYCSILLDYPALATVSVDFAAIGMFQNDPLLIHKIVIHPAIERYLGLIKQLILNNPAILIMKDKEAGVVQFPCDKLRQLDIRQSAEKFKALAIIVNASVVDWSVFSNLQPVILPETVKGLSSAGRVNSIGSVPSANSVSESDSLAVLSVHEDEEQASKRPYPSTQKTESLKPSEPFRLNENQNIDVPTEKNSSLSSSNLAVEEAAVLNSTLSQVSNNSNASNNRNKFRTRRSSISPNITHTNLGISFYADIFNNYKEEEKLIVKAVSYGLPATEEELRTRCYNFEKNIPESKQNILHLCAKLAVTSDVVLREHKALQELNNQVFDLILSILKRRIDLSLMDKERVKKLIWNVEDGEGLTVWNIAIKDISKSKFILESLYKKWGGEEMNLKNTLMNEFVVQVDDESNEIDPTEMMISLRSKSFHEDKNNQSSSEIIQTSKNSEISKVSQSSRRFLFDTHLDSVHKYNPLLNKIGIYREPKSLHQRKLSTMSTYSRGDFEREISRDVSSTQTFSYNGNSAGSGYLRFGDLAEEFGESLCYHDVQLEQAENNLNVVFQHVVQNYSHFANGKSITEMTEDLHVIDELVKQVKLRMRIIKAEELGLVDHQDRDITDSRFGRYDSLATLQFCKLLIMYPGLLYLGKRLAELGIFNGRKRVLTTLLSHQDVLRFLPIIESIVSYSPTTLLISKENDSKLNVVRPLDHAKRIDRDKIRTHILSTVINCTIKCPSYNAMTLLHKYENYGEENLETVMDVSSKLLSRSSFVQSSQNSNGGLSQSTSHRSNSIMSFSELPSDKLTNSNRTNTLVHVDNVCLVGDVFSDYNIEEELIVRAVAYGFEATPKEFYNKQYDFDKRNPLTLNNIFHQCAYVMVSQDRHYTTSVVQSCNQRVLKLALDTLKNRVGNGEMSWTSAHNIVWTRRNRANENMMSILNQEKTRSAVIIRELFDNWGAAREMS